MGTIELLMWIYLSRQFFSIPLFLRSLNIGNLFKFMFTNKKIYLCKTNSLFIIENLKSIDHGRPAYNWEGVRKSNWGNLGTLDNVLTNNFTRKQYLRKKKRKFQLIKQKLDFIIVSLFSIWRRVLVARKGEWEGLKYSPILEKKACVEQRMVEHWSLVDIKYIF